MIANPSSRQQLAVVLAALALAGVSALPARALPEYHPYQLAGWSAPLVLRTTTGATNASAIDSPTLKGDSTNYYNRAVINTGDASSVVIVNETHVDGVFLGGGNSGPYSHNHLSVSLDQGRVITAGLHTLGAVTDVTNLDAESDETNNEFARQLSFTPVYLPLGTTVTRSAPPSPSGGTAPVVGTVYANQDAVRIQSDQAWEVVALTPPAGEDYDLYLYGASTGITDGFRAPLKYSLVGAGLTDFIIVNDNFVGSPPHDAGVEYFAGTFQPYQIEHRQASGALLASGTTYSGLTLAANQMIQIHQYQHVPNAGVPRVSFELSATPGQVLHVALFSGLTSLASRSEAIADAATDAGGHALLDVPLETTGGVKYYGVVVYRDQPDGGTATAGYSLRLRATPADLANIAQAGKTTPMNASNGASNWTTDPVALDGNTTDTNMSFYFTNTGAQTATTYRVDTRLDGQSVLPFAPGAIAPGTTIYQAVAPITVRGGRHTFSYVLDLDGNLDETSEANNLYGRQFVWSPLVMSAGTTYVRPLPPDATGGLDALPAVVTAYFNCDGLRTDPSRLGGPLPLANVVAAMPQSGADVDVDAFPLSTGPLDGFSVPLTTSARGTDLIDLVVNCNESATQPMDVGVRRYLGTTQAFAAQNVFST